MGIIRVIVVVTAKIFEIIRKLLEILKKNMLGA